MRTRHYMHLRLFTVSGWHSVTNLVHIFKNNELAHHNIQWSLSIFQHHLAVPAMNVLYKVGFEPVQFSYLDRPVFRWTDPVPVLLLDRRRSSHNAWLWSRQLPQCDLVRV